METEHMELIYHKIANQIMRIIPVEWSKTFLNAEVLTDSTRVYFYFCPQNKDELVYSNDIPIVYNVSEEIYDKLLFEMFDFFRELQNEFKKNGQDLWTNITMALERTGKFKIDFNYDDISTSILLPSQRRVVWAYKTLGIYPVSDYSKKFLDEYIKEHSI